MRLFIAIELEEEQRDTLFQSVMDLKKESAAGVFSLRENLHLTLVFLGELTRYDGVVRAMEAVKAPPFSLMVEGIGCFRHSRLYYQKVNAPEALYHLYEQLCLSLKAEGLTVETRPYKPHMTLGRQVSVREGFDFALFDRGHPAFSVPVTGITLMKSERVGGKLCYTPLFWKRLEE